MTTLTSPPLVPQGPPSLVARIEQVAGSEVGSRHGIRFLNDQGEPLLRLTWAEIHEQARRAAGRLIQLGVGPGSAVTLFGASSPELVVAIQATWLAGASVVLLPLPMRLVSIEDFISQTRRRVEHTGAPVLLVDTELVKFVESWPGGPRVVSLEELTGGLRGAQDATRTQFAQGITEVVPASVEPTDIAVLQYTSGSTADPKGVILPHAQVCAQVDAARQAAGFDADQDVMVSWLPLYHDMGLIGFLIVPMCTGNELVMAPPQAFTGQPIRWMQWLSDYKATVTAGPNFAYALATKALARASSLDLSSMRIALSGAEQVEPDTVEAFCAAAAPFGFDPRAVFCAFGMAEATLAVTFPETFTGMRVDEVDALAIERDGQALAVGTSGTRAEVLEQIGNEKARTRRLAFLGRPIPGLEIRTVNPETGEECAERQVGELEIRGECVTPGYFKRPDLSEELFHDGWLRTGDLAYIAEGELVVCGRSKDVIIIAGRNVFPEDVERAAASVPGVRPGNVIAFGVKGKRGRESVVVVAETREGYLEAMRAAVSERVRHSVGIPVEDVVFVQAGSLPKTSSGKLQRALCRRRYEDGTLQRVS